nr:hypothetical protein [Tanacetum cinerariifolium]
DESPEKAVVPAELPEAAAYTELNCLCGYNAYAFFSNL